MQLRSKLAAALLAGAAGTAVLAGCGSPAQSHAPLAAYGQGTSCYYVYNPAEVGQLKAAGLCPQNSFPVQAPQSWLDEYYYYYDSPLYYDSYVPAQYRTAYVRTYMPGELGSHRSDITTRSRKATYYSTSGATVRGVTSTAKFGSGSSFGKAGHSTGSLRVGSSPTARASLPVVRSTTGRANVPGFSGYTPPAKKTASPPRSAKTSGRR